MSCLSKIDKSWIFQKCPFLKHNLNIMDQKLDLSEATTYQVILVFKRLKYRTISCEIVGA